MAETTNQISGDVIDAIRPDLEAFASLWSALRTNYQGTNITKTVARLLHMYQPEDGVLAYERLLGTLYVLLEDFDGDGLRLLVSMVPPPKGVPDETIKEVFHKATGFVRLNAPIFHRNSNSSNLENETSSSLSKKIDGGSSDPRTPVTNPGTPRLQSFRNGVGNAADASTILRAVVKADVPRKSNKSPKIPPRESEVFRGFPSNEITTTQSHARNMTHFYRPSMNYGGYAVTQRYVNYHQVQGQNGSSNPPRGIDPSAYRLNWFETPMLVCKNNYDGSPAYPDLILKTSDNKYIRLPITNVNGPPMSNYTSSYNPPLQQAYQTYPNNQIHMRNNAINTTSSSRDFSTNLSNHPNAKKAFEDRQTMDELTIRKVEASRMNLIDHDYELTKSDENSEDKENFATGKKGSPTDATIEKFRDAVKSRQRAIQEDIYRMDVVRCDQEIGQASTEEFKTLDVESFTIDEELKKGIQNFLKRAEEGKSLDPPPFPRTRALERPRNFPPSLLKSSPRMWKLERLTEYPGSWKQSADSRQTFTEESASFFPHQKMISSMKSSTLGDSCKNRGTRSKMGKNPVATKSERTSQKVSNSARISSDKSLNQGSSFGIENTNVAGHEVMPATESQSKTIDAFHQANSMSELVNYRKQYYDALLSIQRAKVAVANSLAISSSQTSTNYDPRVFQYLQQQHQMLHQQQQQLLMSSQHPVTRPTIVQPGYSNIRSAAGLWIRPNDWKYPPCGQYAFPRKTHSMSSSPCTSQIPMNMPKDSSMAENLRRSSHHLHRASQRPPVKRRKLEEIVGKLKESDDN